MTERLDQLPAPSEDRGLFAAGQAPEVLSVGVAGADRHDLDPLPARGQSLLDRTLGRIGIPIGQDDEVTPAIASDELAARLSQKSELLTEARRDGLPSSIENEIAPKPPSWLTERTSLSMWTR